MTFFDSMIETYQFNRTRTDATLERIEQLEDPSAALAFRPGEGRAHVAWQFMHIGITEDIFASERLAPSKRGIFTDLWSRYRGGSTPDDSLPGLTEIRAVLEQSRANLLETLGTFGEADLDTVPEAFSERGLTIRTVLHILSWHESHHQGQAHLTLNLLENR